MSSADWIDGVSSTAAPLKRRSSDYGQPHATRRGDALYGRLVVTVMTTIDFVPVKEDAPSERHRHRPATAARAFSYSPDFAPGAVRVLEVTAIAFCGAGLWMAPEMYNKYYPSQHIFFVVFLCFVYLYLANWSGLYSLNALMRPISNIDKVIIAFATSFTFMLSIVLGLDVYYFYNNQWLFYFAGTAAAALVAIRIGSFGLLRVLSKQGVVGRNLVVLGGGRQGALFLRKVTRDPPYFTSVVGVFTATAHDAPPDVEGYPVLGSIDDLLSYARRGVVDDVVVALPWNDDRRVIGAIETLKELPVNVYLGADLVGFDLTFRPVVGAFSQLPVFEVVLRPISGWSAAIKIALDYLVATLALLVVAPLFFLVAVMIKLDSPGPVFFVQRRLGFNNRPFSIYKFRSMRDDVCEDAVVKQAQRGDPRVTRVGRIIRATSIDELPQLLNVLDGTMSLVGPRPHALSHNEEYGAQIRGYFARHKVKPGITGWAQVNGLRGETADVETMRRRVEHDVYYVENWSFLFDLKILALTAAVVLFQRTAY